MSLVLLASCSRDGASGSESGSADASVASSAARSKRASRSTSAGLVLLRGHLDFGRLAEALALTDEIARAEGEAPVLRARLAALSGKTIDALRNLESARAANPSDPDLYATAAEIYAIAERKETAWSELERGEKACGLAPEILRAKGILWLTREGGAARALGYLEEARRADPTLPYCDRALAQAHVLVAKDAARAGDWQVALASAQRSIEHDPDDTDVRRFLADARSANGDFDGALAILVELAAAGEPLQGDLASTHKRAAMACLIRRERERALEHFAAARRYGLGDDELGTGARLLDEEAQAQVEKGVAAYERSDLDAAERSFRASLACQPDSPTAQNHLAVVLFQRRSFAEAAELWQRVLATALKEGLDLPEPVHLNLAKAQFQAGDPTAARATLEAYLARTPDGTWAEPTQQMLTLLDAR
ncbi:MAG: tetratricopeptide repeat protein [Planctomycetota bacterium]